jgi:hypothetical protein
MAAPALVPTTTAGGVRKDSSIAAASAVCVEIKRTGWPPERAYPRRS